MRTVDWNDRQGLGAMFVGFMLMAIVAAIVLLLGA
jgi:hypothetical protein